MHLIETARMLLRPMEMSDADDLLKIFSDPEAMRYYPGTRDTEQTREWIGWNLESYRRDGFGLWIASLKTTGAFAGQCGLVTQEVEGRQEVEIGYLFLRSLWGQGLATEAARACRDYARHVLGLRRVISLIDPANMASCRVAEKAGMTLEKEIYKWDKKVSVYSMSF